MEENTVRERPALDTRSFSGDHDARKTVCWPLPCGVWRPKYSLLMWMLSFVDSGGVVQSPHSGDPCDPRRRSLPTTSTSGK